MNNYLQNIKIPFVIDWLAMPQERRFDFLADYHLSCGRAAFAEILSEAAQAIREARL